MKPHLRILILFCLAAATCAAQTAALSIATTSPLPAATVGAAYSVTFAASGGTPPYQWSATQGLPTGLTLSPGGVLSGKPTSPGTFNQLSIQVTDAAQHGATASFSLTINPAPLTITTVPPLFAGVVGTLYVQTFSASGGVSPYRWTITSGSLGDLSLDAVSGTIQGTPQSAGTLSFTVQVTDNAGTKVAKAFTITITPPALTITNTPLPNGAVGASYSQKFGAAGGTLPYTWSLAQGSTAPPGLTFNASQATLSGIPTTAGTFTFTLQAADSAGLTTTRAFTLAIAPAALSITSAMQLPDANLGAPYSYHLAASGGVPPYTWSANGLPSGLSLDASSGLISGVVNAAGALSFTVRVADTTQASAVNLFHLNVSLPPLPAVQISGLPGNANPAQQFALQVTLASGYPVALSGQAILTFSPDSGNGDATVQFAGGGTTGNFAIAAGATAATSTPALAIQTGTVAGTIKVSLHLQGGGLDVTPSLAPAASTHIDGAAPVIQSAKLVRSSSGFNIQIIGFSTSREVTQAVYAFTAASGQTLQASQATIPLGTLFATWYQDPANTAYGSQFLLTQPFTIQGDANSVLPQSVTLSNRVGSTTASITQ